MQHTSQHFVIFCARVHAHTFLNVNKVLFTCEITSFHSSNRPLTPSHF